MTTVAFDGSSMSCDTMMTDGCTKVYITTKIIKSREFVLGWAGNVGVARRVLAGVAALDLSELLMAGIKGQEDLEERMSILLVCRETKQAFMMVGNNFISVNGYVHAIGSGANVAIGAMLCGATSKEAVKMAAKVDLNTGGKIITVRV
jgi:ATP-dependent protease HslVU (ClpYQ) peptidase subunit